MSNDNYGQYGSGGGGGGQYGSGAGGQYGSGAGGQYGGSGAAGGQYGSGGQYGANSAQFGGGDYQGGAALDNTSQLPAAEKSAFEQVKDRVTAGVEAVKEKATELAHKVREVAGGGGGDKSG